MTSLTANSTSLQHSSTQAVLRLTALWAVVESGLGGVLHAFKLPLTGLVIGGTAIVLITLIAHFAAKPREILRATVIVLIIKALVSPHSPIGAYLAVSFQGVLGWIIYSVLRPGYASSLPFALLSMVESAIQKLLMLVLFFGKPLWTSVDSWGNWVMEKYFPSHVEEGLSLSWTLVAGYVGVYVVGGILVGLLAARIPSRIATHLAELEEQPFAFSDPSVQENVEAPPVKKRNKKQRRLLWWIGIALALGASIYWGESSNSAVSSAVVYLVKTLAIVAVWYFLVGPWLARIFRKWLLGRSSQYANELDEVMEVLPQLKQVAKQEFTRLSESYSGVGLYRRWLMRVLAVSLTNELSRNPTGPPAPKPMTDSPPHAE